MVGVDTVFLFDHTQITPYRPQKWCDQKKKRWEFHPVCPLMFWYQHLLKKCEFVPILSNWLKPYSQAV
jgi:hypothetical protein